MISFTRNKPELNDFVFCSTKCELKNHVDYLVFVFVLASKTDFCNLPLSLFLSLSTYPFITCGIPKL